MCCVFVNELISNDWAAASQCTYSTCCPGNLVHDLCWLDNLACQAMECWCDRNHSYLVWGQTSVCELCWNVRIFLVIRILYFSSSKNIFVNNYLDWMNHFTECLCPKPGSCILRTVLLAGPYTILYFHSNIFLWENICDLPCPHSILHRSTCC